MFLKLGALLITASFACAITAGTIYTWTDSEGIKHFSDKPPQGEERLVVDGDIKTGKLRIDKFSSMSTYTPPTTGGSLRSEDANTPTSGELVTPPSTE